METFEKTSEVTVRLDSDHGNEFFCHESQSDTLRVDNSGMWRACLAKLVRSTPGVRVADFPREIVYYEPVFLSLFARSGWEIYHVEQDNGDGKLEAGNGHRYFLRK